MAVDAHEVERRLAMFAQELRGHGLRLTRQRLEVVRAVAETDGHPAVEDVFQCVRGRIPNVSLDTVYRTLSALAELGLVRRVNLLPGAARYDANVSRHHHLVCSRCGSVKDVDAADVPGTDTVAYAHWPDWGRVESYEVLLHGVCNDCEEDESERRESRRE